MLDPVTKQCLKEGLVKRLKTIIGQPTEEDIIRSQQQKIIELEAKLKK
jgi:hypothetical protein